MKTFSVICTGFVAFGLWAAPAQAQQPRPHRAGDVPGPIDSIDDLQDSARMIFKLADENNDGQISQKEAVDAANLAVGGFFFRADQNGDGVLSRDEARAARESFLNTKPWLRYVVETAKTAKPAAGATRMQPSNVLAALAGTFDSNNDKQLQATELRQAVQTAVQGEFALADTNRDGQLSPSELNASVAGVGRQVAQSVFQQADTDGNGQISQAEFEKAVIEPARVAFKVMDLNHDGQISPDESQTARRVLMSRVRSLNFPEPANSPRHQLDRALGNPTEPAPAPAPPAAPPGR